MREQKGHRPDPSLDARDDKLPAAAPNLISNGYFPLFFFEAALAGFFFLSPPLSSSFFGAAFFEAVFFGFSSSVSLPVSAGAFFDEAFF